MRGMSTLKKFSSPLCADLGPCSASHDKCSSNLNKPKAHCNFLSEFKSRSEEKNFEFGIWEFRLRNALNKLVFLLSVALDYPGFPQLRAPARPPGRPAAEKLPKKSPVFLDRGRP